jgi:hypothetical protein
LESGVDEIAPRIVHRVIGYIDRGLDALIFFPPLALDAARLLESKFGAHRLDVFGGGLSWVRAGTEVSGFPSA